VEIPRTFVYSRCQGLSFIGPTEGLGHGLVEEIDEAADFRIEVFQRDEIAAADDFAREDREQHLDLIEPRGMLGREVKDDAVVGVAQELLARSHRFEDAAFAFDPEVGLEADDPGNQAYDRLGAMDIEIVHHQVTMGLGRARGKQCCEVAGKVLLSASRAEPVADRAGGHIEIGDEGGGAVADVLELSALGVGGTHRLCRRSTLERLHTGHFIDAVGLGPDAGALRGKLVGPADIGVLGRKVGIAGGVDPAAGTVGLELDLAQETINRVGREALDDAAFARRAGE